MDTKEEENDWNCNVPKVYAIERGLSQASELFYRF